jgi:hypothetical protein
MVDAALHTFATELYVRVVGRLVDGLAGTHADTVKGADRTEYP